MDGLCLDAQTRVSPWFRVFLRVCGHAAPFRPPRPWTRTDWGPSHYRGRSENSLCVPKPDRGPLVSETALGLTRAATRGAPLPGSLHNGEMLAAAPGRWRSDRGALQGRGAGVAETASRRRPEPGPRRRERRSRAFRESPGRDRRCPWCCRPRARAPGGSVGRCRPPLRAAGTG